MKVGVTNRRIKHTIDSSHRGSGARYKKLFLRGDGGLVRGVLGGAGV